MDTKPFAPHFGSTLTLTAGASSLSSPISARNQQVRILNTGVNIAFIRIGDGPQTATTADYPIAPGQSTVITKAVGNNGLTPQEIGYISAAGTTLYVTTGNGF